MQFAVACFVLCLTVAAHAAILDEYVNAGPQYVRYELRPDLNLNGTSLDGKSSWSAVAVNMTSQQWLTAEDWGADWGGANAEWWHMMYIITPSVVAPNAKTGKWRSMYVTGGKNTDKAPAADDEDILGSAVIAMASQQVMVTLFHVPNVPIYLKSEPLPQPRLGEDDFLSHTMIMYMNYMRDGGSADSVKEGAWVPLLPMVKAGMAAISATEDILGDEQYSSKWTVTGASKRGWTAWLMGAVDATRPAEQRRIQAIAPIVLDGLNFHKFFHLHYGAYGGWSFAMRAFQDTGFTGRIDTPEMTALLNVMDPYVYLQRLKGLPKFVLDATGDEWFLPDDSRNWIDYALEVASPIHLGMIPDADHSMVTGLPSLLPNIATFFHNVARGRANPHISFKLDRQQGTMSLTVDDEFDALPRLVQMWHSQTCHSENGRRDFRMANQDAVTSEDRKCGCGPAFPGSDASNPNSAPQCFNLRTGIWANNTLTADLTIDPSGRTYTASVKPPLAIERRWEGFFMTVTFGDVAPSMKQQQEGMGDRKTGSNLGDADSCEMHLVGGRKSCLPVLKPGDMTVATPVVIVPDLLPFSCSGEECQGGALL